jgi:excisionase family DNA binding protein
MMSLSTRDIETVASNGVGRRHRRDQIKLYTIRQIADALVVSTRTVRRLIEDGHLVAHRIKGLVRISEADFVVFLAAQRDD